VATELSGEWTFDRVAEVTASLIREELGVDTVGVAVRRGVESQRCQQLIHRGPLALGVEDHRGVLGYVEQRLLPRTMRGSQTLHWADLTDTTDHGRAFGGVGLTSAAACALTGSDEVVGVLWVGQRGGESLERHHLLMLETVAPLIAARLELADQFDRLDAMALVDARTRLLNREAVLRMAERSEQAGRPWSMLRIASRGGGVHQWPPAAWSALVSTIGRMTRRSNVLTQLDESTLALVMPGVDAGGAAAVASRLSDGLGEWVRMTGHELSIGWSASPGDGRAAEAIIDAAGRREQPVTGQRAAA
jgi:hypothetical protein